MLDTVPEAHPFNSAEYALDEVGRVVGGSAVSSGQFEYTIPLELPPGRSGMTPNIGLAYSSGSGSGALGVGWSLRGAVSVIARCGKNLARDGVVEGSLEQDSNFCLNGEKLVPIEEASIPKPAPLTQMSWPTFPYTEHLYRLEGTRNVRVIRYEAIGGGSEVPRRWAALYPNGRIDLYGESNEETNAEGRGIRLSDGPSWTTYDPGTLHWYRHLSIDRWSNLIAYKFILPPEAPAETATRVLSEVTWGHGLPGTTYAGAKKRSLTLEYESRDDALESWTAAIPLVQKTRLATLSVAAPPSHDQPSTVFRRYKLSYTESERTGRSLLQQVELCDVPGDRCLPPTKFTYGQAAKDENEPVGNDHFRFRGRASWGARFGLGDLVGNFDDTARDEILHIDPDDNATTMWLTTFSTFAPDPNDPFHQQGVEVDILGSVGDTGIPIRDTMAAPDLDGDGTREVAGTVASTDVVAVYGAGSPTWSLLKLVAPPNYAFVSVDSLFGADIDGDGRQDLAALLEPESSQTAIRTYGLWRTEDASDMLEDYDSALTVSNVESAVPTVFDINGDGAHDIVHEDLFVHVAQGHPYGGTFPTNTTDDPFVYLDINGDGRMDLFNPDDGNVCVGTGFGFGPCRFASGLDQSDLAEVTGTLISYVPGDFDGDGKSDLLAVRRKYDSPAGLTMTLYVARWGGYWDTSDVLAKAWSWQSGASSSVSPYDHIAAGDFDGDGRLDFVRSSGSDSLQVMRQPRTSPNEFADHLVKVEDGLHLVDEVTYRTFSEETDAETDPVHTPDSNCSYPIRCMRKGPPLVAEHSQYEVRMFNQGPPEEVSETRRDLSYRYFGGRTHLRGRGFLGFREIVVSDTGNATTTTLTYDQSPVMPPSGDMYGYVAFPFAGRPLQVTRLTNVSGGTTQQLLVSSLSTLSATVDASGYYRTQLDSQLRSVTEWNVNGTQSASRTTVYAQHNAYGQAQLITRTDEVGDVRRVELTYDNRPNDWLLGMVSEAQTTTTSGSDTRFTKMSFGHNGAGQLSFRRMEQDTPSGNNDATRHRETRYSYTLGGMMDSIEDEALGTALPVRATTLAYDADGTFPTSAQNALGHTTQVETDLQTGRVRRVMDANCVTSEQHVDLLGRVVALYRADGSGMTVRYHQPFEASSSDPGADAAMAIRTQYFGGADVYAYADGFGRIVAVDRSHPLAGEYRRLERHFDDQGRVTDASLPVTAVPRRQSPPVTPTPGVADRFSTEFDQLGRPLERYAPGDTLSAPLETWTYPSITSVVHQDRAGRKQKTLRDLAGRTLSLARLDGAGATLNATTLEYDPLGLVKSISGPGYLQTRTHDDLGRLVNSTDTESGARTFVYNAFGEVTQESAPASITRTMTYDVLGRLTTLGHENGTDTLFWDTDPTGGKGRLGSTLSADGSTTGYEYDVLGRLSKQLVGGAGPTREANFSYDALGRVSQVSYPPTPGGYSFQVQYQYASHGELVELKDVQRGQPLWSANAWDDRGRVTDYTLGDREVNVVESYDDVFGRLKSVEAYLVDSPTQNIVDHDYLIGPDGRLGKLEDTSVDALHTIDRVEEYQYDEAGRLEQWLLERDGGHLGGGTSEQRNYTFDTMGRLHQVQKQLNGLGVGAETYVYDDFHPHRAKLLEGPEYEMGYDAMGRMTSRVQAAGGDPLDRVVSSYSHFNLPREGTVGGQTFNVNYTVGGERESLSLGTGTAATTVHYLGKLSEVRETHQDTTYVHRVFSDRGVIAQVEIPADASATEGPARVRYMVNDHRGSRIIALDEGETVPERYFQDPNGRQVSESGAPLFSSLNDGLTEGLTGHEDNLELGLVNMVGRAYDPTVRRFTTPDPVVDGVPQLGSVDPYRHVIFDPINYTDPTGLSVTDVPDLADYYDDHGDAWDDGFGGQPEQDGPWQEEPGYIDGPTVVEGAPAPPPMPQQAPSAGGQSAPAAVPDRTPWTPMPFFDDPLLGTGSPFWQRRQREIGGVFLRPNEISSPHPRHTGWPPTPGMVFDTPDEAAIAALLIAVENTLRDNIEYGGDIVRILRGTDAGRYQFVGPRPGRPGGFRDEDEPLSLYVPDYATFHSGYHSHDNGNPRFSRDDLWFSTTTGFPEYVGTRDDSGLNIRRFTPGPGFPRSQLSLSGRLSSEGWEPLFIERGGIIQDLVWPR